ncbi:HesA/MoeB/ThiF family protein [Pontimicrobium aquaticum]|uniref:Molybdopterin-synthase adenylyltransferase n=1 Tax=Pontimicrobium aquaticum TaxID=2565367 RepID=A0A4U0ETV2_9FLAO|nr:HesA/MoeB/ThiF family protein [Pontimicrobium aquaticum]TJY34654.1 dinucleotide-utilizing protein [Pontimicrobium aquaticum]
MRRYNRHIILSDVGPEGQNKISNAKVLVVGAGGLGCPILQYLAAAGVGTLGVIDLDVVEESNLQRQILFGSSSLGVNKALAAKERLEDLNPTITINAYHEALTPQNALGLFNNYDIIVDGTDNFETRYLINDASIITNKPLVYGAIYKFEGQVSVFNYNNGPSYRCLFPVAPKNGSIANCSEVGVLGVLPGIIGTMQANEVLKIILEFNGILSGKLFCYNSKTSETYSLKIKRLDSEIDKVLSKKESFQTQEFTFYCNSKDVSLKDLQEFENIQFIDVREPHEEPKVTLDNCIQIPLKELETKTNQIPTDKTIIAFCQSGIRSKTAVEILEKHSITNCFSLKEGALAIIEQQKIKA